jgi:hypothetical protein
VPFELRLHESINGGAYVFQSSLQDNGINGGDCITTFAWDVPAGARALLLEAYVGGIKVAQALVYATVSEPVHTPEWNLIANGSIAHNGADVDVTGVLQHGGTYRVCLTGTIRVYTDAAQHTVADINPQQAYMQVSVVFVTGVSGFGYCVQFDYFGGFVTVHCDGATYYTHGPYYGTVSGVFAINIYALQ